MDRFRNIRNPDFMVPIGEPIPVQVQVSTPVQAPESRSRTLVSAPEPESRSRTLVSALEPESRSRTLVSAPEPESRSQSQAQVPAIVPDPRQLINPQRINSLLKMQEMLFIYNAVIDGWTVHKLVDGRFEFQKERHKVTSDVCLDSYLKDFVDYYLRTQPNQNQ